MTLIPTGRLSLLPLHAARYRVDGAEVCFLDEFTVAYAPSARAVASARVEAGRRGAAFRLAGVGNPLPDVKTGAWAVTQAADLVRRLSGVDVTALLAPSPDGLPAEAQALLAAVRSQAGDAWQRTWGELQGVSQATPEEAIRAGKVFLDGFRLLLLAPDARLDGARAILAGLVERVPASLDYAEAELRSILDLLPRDGAWAGYSHEATRAALWDALPAATCLHLACHGRFDAETPLDSALLLAQDTA